MFLNLQEIKLKEKSSKRCYEKVLDKYILKEKKSRQNKNLVSYDEINKKNEYTILKLNDNIREINYFINF